MLQGARKVNNLDDFAALSLTLKVFLSSTYCQANNSSHLVPIRTLVFKNVSFFHPTYILQPLICAM